MMPSKGSYFSPRRVTFLISFDQNSYHFFALPIHEKRLQDIFLIARRLLFDDILG